MAVHVRCAGVLGAVLTLAGCGWHGLNSLPLPGTAGGGAGAYTVSAELPDITGVEQNSRVQVGDVTVGTVTSIERQGWHASVTMRIDGNVALPANSTATVGQTSLLGSMHIELAPPSDEPPVGHLHTGSVIPLTSGASYPTTEQTLAALSLLLNGGGLGQVQDITQALAIAFAGREGDLRSLIDQLAQFSGHLDNQSQAIIAATDSLNALTARFAAQQPILSEALRSIPAALKTLAEDRQSLTDALERLGSFSGTTADIATQTQESLADEMRNIAPVLHSLADAGPALTRSASLLATFPLPKETLSNFLRGDFGNATLILDLTLSRVDAAVFTGTRFEGQLTELEMQWGRTIGQLPSPYTANNPLTAPYHRDSGH